MPGQLAGRVAPRTDNDFPVYVIGILTNMAAQACELRGYPDLSVSGYLNGRPGVPSVLPVSITHGPVTAHRPDSGPVTVRLEPGGSASFDFRPEQVEQILYVLIELRVTLPDTADPVTSNVLMGAGAPAQGAAIPLIVTGVRGRSCRTAPRALTVHMQHGRSGGAPGKGHRGPDRQTGIHFG